jgi:hypothetical protein
MSRDISALHDNHAPSFTRQVFLFAYTAGRTCTFLALMAIAFMG